jgi:hypothetical protein
MWVFFTDIFGSLLLKHVGIFCTHILVSFTNISGSLLLKYVGLFYFLSWVSFTHIWLIDTDVCQVIVNSKSLLHIYLGLFYTHIWVSFTHIFEFLLHAYLGLFYTYIWVSFTHIFGSLVQTYVGLFYTHMWVSFTSICGSLLLTYDSLILMLMCARWLWRRGGWTSLLKSPVTRRYMRHDIRRDSYIRDMTHIYEFIEVARDSQVLTYTSHVSYLDDIHESCLL